MELKQKLTDLVLGVSSKNACQLVDLQIKGNSEHRKLVVLLDTESGISIEECSKVSRELAALIEIENVIEGAYTLEVSSPGIDVPFNDKKKYEKNIGRILKVALLAGNEKVGKLTNVTNESITIEGQGKPGKVKKEDKIIVINFDQIKESKVQVSFN